MQKYITVGRWMSKQEYDKMIKTDKVQESFCGTTYVANPAKAEAFMKQTPPYSYYVEFDVLLSYVQPTSDEGWAKIIGPNSVQGRLAKRKGLPIPEMPAAINIHHKATKLG
jgi:hypothetical protein